MNATTPENVRSVASVASELVVLASSLENIANDLRRAPAGSEWTASSGRHFVDRLGNVESLVGRVKLEVEVARQAAIRSAS